MSDFDDASEDDEPPIFYERRPKEVFSKNEKESVQSTESDSEIMILSNHDKNTEKKSQDNLKNTISGEIHQNDLLDSLLNDSDSSSDSVHICSSPINNNFPRILENLSSSQPTSLSLEPAKRQENSQPIILSVGSESDSYDSDKSDFQDLNFDHIRSRNQNSQNSQELFNFSFPFTRNRTQNVSTSQNDKNDTDLQPTNDETQEFINGVKELRSNFVKGVQELAKKCKTPIPANVDVSHPPIYETMSDDELRHELANYGFRFKTRVDAISKLFRCWSAIREKESLQTKSISNKASNTHLNPIDFIRIHSKFYEQILIYQPIPLASLHREMTEAGVKITVNRLKSILDDEGVAFFDDVNAIHPGK